MDKLNEIEDSFKHMELYEQLIAGEIGLAVLLFGYRIKKIAFFVIWFLIGYNLMIFLMPTLISNIAQIAESELFQILIPIAGGILLALLGFSIEKVCVSGICFFLVMLITVQYFGTEVPTLVIGGIVGVVAGAVATALMKPAIIVATSMAGSYAITLVILSVFPDISKEIFYFPLIGGIALLGAFFQFLTTKKVK